MDCCCCQSGFHYHYLHFMTTHRDSIEDIYDKLTHFPNYVNTICLESIDLVRYCAMTTNSRCFKIGDGVCGIYVDVRWNSSIWQAVKVLKYRKLTSIFEKTISASLWRISDGMERWKHPCGLMSSFFFNLMMIIPVYFLRRLTNNLCLFYTGCTMTVHYFL